MKNKKIIIKTIISVLLIELIILFISGGILYKYYNKITATKSGVSDKTIDLEIKQISIAGDNENIENNGNSENEENNNILYHGIFGKIEHENISFQEKIENKDIYKKEDIYKYSINTSEFNRYIILKTLYDNNLLDKYLYNGILNNNISVEKIEMKNILDFITLIGYSDKELSNKAFLEYDKMYNELINNYNKSYKDKNFIEISKLLSEYENIIKIDKLENIKENITINSDLIKENITINSDLIKDENFKYIINQLTTGNYSDNINKVSEKIGVDKNLIRSAIGVEQLRYLSTDRGYAKKLIKGNKYLTNFSKFSYGLGGIKIPTYKKINSWLKTYDNDIYIKHFKVINDNAYVNTENGLEYDDNKIKDILNNHYNSTLYVGGLLLSIQEKRNIDGFNIDNNPGVIITLYNMGNSKTPHGNPDVGGSIIKLNDLNSYYFGELGLIMYHYMKYYIN